MAIAVQQIYPAAHLPLILGVLRRLEVATVIDRLLPSHPAHVFSGGRGVEALVLAILDGDHALYKVGKRLAERGMLNLPQPGLTRASLHAYRLGYILDALFAANLNQVFSAIALKALEVYTIPTPWLLRTPRRLRSMGPMKTNQRYQERPGQPTGTARRTGRSQAGASQARRQWGWRAPPAPRGTRWQPQ